MGGQDNLDVPALSGLMEELLLVKAGGKLPLVVKAHDEDQTSDQDQETHGDNDRDNGGSFSFIFISLLLVHVLGIRGRSCLISVLRLRVRLDRVLIGVVVVHGVWLGC